MSTQPEAIRLSIRLAELADVMNDSAAELRRLHARLQELESALIVDCMTHEQQASPAVDERGGDSRHARARLDGWLQEKGLLYRLTDERRPRNRDEIVVTMANGSRSVEACSRLALELLGRIGSTDSPQQAAPQQAAPVHLGPLELMKVVMEAEESMSGHHTRGTTNWAATIGKAVQDAVLAAQKGGA